jgi:hypothetical protein
MTTSGSFIAPGALPGTGRDLPRPAERVALRDRRFAVPFDPEHFAKQAAAGCEWSALEVFRYAHDANHWSGSRSVSGPGASLDQTRVIRAALPTLCHRLDVRTLLDLPCGDASWITTMPLPGIAYIGADCVPALIDENIRTRSGAGREFRLLDLLEAPLPDADLMVCRDCLVHLSFADIARAIANVKASRITWLLTTTFPWQLENEDIHTGDWRPLDLQRAPFGWPPPHELINEECTEGDGLFADKSLGLWRVSALPAVELAR